MKEPTNMIESTTHFGYETIPTQDKLHKVQAVFNSVAHRYDLMNDAMSFGLHRLWKRLAIAQCGIEPDHHILDLAGGTGDLTSLICDRLGEKGRVFLTDINESMINCGRNRLLDEGKLNSISLSLANAEALPFQSESFDSVIISFGLRNVTDKNQALREMYRVLKAQGRLIILEFSHVTSKPFSFLYDVYSFSILPRLGKLLAKDESSYRYLVESIRKHPSQEHLKDMMFAAGFAEVSYQNVQGGVVAIHKGVKS